jgi:carbonic anhydrase/acetyltransferase-like protein (isoleucine patch superfamily)
LKDRADWLIRKGVKIGSDVFIGGGFYIDEGFEKFLTIEDNAVIAANVSVVVHDSAMNNICGLPIRFGKVVIGRNAYIGYGSIIMPGVKIGENSLIGAGSIVMKDIPANMVAYGSPAKVVQAIDEYKEIYKQKMIGDKYYYWDTMPWRGRHKTYSAADESRLFSEFITENKARIFSDAPSVLDIGGIESYRYLAEGWYDIEDWPPLIRWTSKSASLFLGKGPTHEELRIRYYNKGCSTLSIDIDNGPPSGWILKTDCWDDAIVKLRHKGQSYVLKVSMEVDRIWTPGEIGNMEDKRDLGIAVEKIWLE